MAAKSAAVINKKEEKLMKKFLSVLFALLVAMSALPALGEELFPLAEPVTFRINVATSNDVADLEKSPYYQEMLERTNVKIELVSLGQAGEDALTMLNLLYNSGDYGDAIWGGSLIAEADYSQLAAANILADLKPYIEDTAVMPNFNSVVLAESPNTKAFITSPDGGIYSLPGYNKEAGAYLESPICINAKWMETLGLEYPTTIEEFKQVLIAFRDGDPNGNKIKDEIPYIFLEGNAWQHLEALLGCWGLATKDNTLDNFVMVQDGKVIFVPIAEGYKAALTELNDWYEEGLLWSEGFVSNNETLMAKRTSDPEVVGVFSVYGAAYYGLDVEEPNDWVQILPPTVEGYDRCWYYHPGWQGIKGKFSMTTKCENPEILMHYMDTFYDPTENVYFYSGRAEDGRYEIDEDGRINFITLDDAAAAEINQAVPAYGSFITDSFICRPASFYTDMLKANDGNALVRAAAYKMYSEAGIINDEIWPRPYMNEDDSVRLSELRTDIFNVVTEKRAKWVTGEADIEAEWDAYVEQLNRLGLEEFLSILQGAYDDYLSHM